MLASTFIIEQFAINLIEAIKANIRGKQVTPFGSAHATGEAENSLFYRITDNNLIIGSTWAYIRVLEDGRKPGKFAPPEVIEKWIGDKPVTSDLPVRSLAYLINKKLAEKGSLIYQQGGKSGILSDYLNFDYIHDNLTLPLAKNLVDQVTEILFKVKVAA